MSRGGFASAMRAIARDAARAHRAQQQALTRQEAAKRRSMRDAERQAKADAKEATRLYLAARIEEADALTHEVQDREAAINTLLARALTKNPALCLSTLLTTFEPGRFDERPWMASVPKVESFLPEPPGFFQRLMPGSKKRHEHRVANARSRFRVAETEHQKRQRARAVALEAFQEAEATRKSEIEGRNEAILRLERGLEAGEHEAVIAYLKLVFDRNLEGEPDAISVEVGYSPGSRHLVADVELPEFVVVPEETSFKYVKLGDRIDPVIRPGSKRKLLYSHLISQIALKCIDIAFRSSPASLVDCLTLNGMLDTIDPSSGQQIRVCLLSVRLTSSVFQNLNLA